MSERVTSTYEVIENFGYGLLIEPSLLGLCREFEIEDQRYFLHFPRIPKESSVHKALDAPISKCFRSSNYWDEFFKGDFFPWGDEYSAEEIDFQWQVTSVNIRRFIYGFEIADRQSGFTSGVEQSIKEWDQLWSRMKNWLEVLTNQDSVFGSTIPSKNRRLDIWQDRGIDADPALNVVSIIQAENLLPSRPLTMTDFEKAFNNALWGIDALLEELLIRDARQALHNLNPRRAVVDSATAIEVIISNELGYTKTDKKTLGSLLNDWIDRGHRTPQGLGSDFVDLRNAVVHNGRVPTRDEGVASLGFANSLNGIAKTLK